MNYGILFNNRRQSRDRRIIEDIIKETGGNIFMDDYSLPMFLEYKEISDNYFAERNCPKLPEMVTVYNWNRKYPADVYLPIDLTQYELLEETEFPGYSHEKITKQFYKRKDIK